jgi:MFS transporter, MHS family, proline/betaine transporter
MHKQTKQIIIVASGTIMQWYDFGLFGFLAPIIAGHYFPNHSPLASLLYTFTIFAVSFLLMPIGGLLFGYIGDNFGRKKALSLSILGMAISTGFIAVIPTYEHIGLAATVLLTCSRILQGLLASAEFSGSAIFLVEHAQSHKTFFYGSLTSSAYSFGSVIAAVATFCCTASFLPTWGWRLPFVIALLGGILVYHLRKRILETPAYIQLQRTKKHSRKSTFLTALKEHPAAVLYTFLIAGFVGIITFGTYVYATSYLVLYSHLSLTAAIAITMIALIVDASLEPFIALLADKYNGKAISVIGTVLIMLFAYPIFLLLSSGSWVYALIGMVTLSCLIAVTYAPMNALLVLLFPPECRYSGFSVSFNLSMAIFGGTTPVVLSWLIYWSHNILSPAIYYMAGGCMCLWAIRMLHSHQAEVVLIER